ncbi:MAG: NAD kinase [Bacteroidales bacterium]|nr:NAD kinase [Bacteroidales bacterium]
MRIAVYGKKISTEFFPYFQLICEKFSQYGADIILYRELYENVRHDFDYQFNHNHFFSEYTDLGKEVDFLLSVGGDGTFLESVSFVRRHSIPIIGINSGRLGFLASISRENISKSIDAIFSRKFTLEKRSLIELKDPKGILQDFPFALNEFAVQKKGTGMINIEVMMDGKHLNTYWADGLIVSSPTGSTGYSMSVGGPIVIPGSMNFILSPIAPHNLTVRPVVIPDNYELTVKVSTRQNAYWVSMDSRSEVYTGQVPLKIKKAGFFIQVLKLENIDYFETLRTKLMWGADKRM